MFLEQANRHRPEQRPSIKTALGSVKEALARRPEARW